MLLFCLLSSLFSLFCTCFFPFYFLFCFFFIIEKYKADRRSPLSPLVPREHWLTSDARCNRALIHIYIYLYIILRPSGKHGCRGKHFLKARWREREREKEKETKRFGMGRIPPYFPIHVEQLSHCRPTCVYDMSKFYGCSAGPIPEIPCALTFVRIPIAYARFYLRAEVCPNQYHQAWHDSVLQFNFTGGKRKKKALS